MSEQTKDKDVTAYSISMKKQIQNKTKNIEANIISCLWENPQLYFDFDTLDSNKFKTPIWKFYFTIGKKMVMKSIKKIEEADVDLFLDGKEKLQEAYNEFGGFDTIRDLQEVCSVENVEVYIEELFKWDVIWNVIDKFTVDNNQLDRIESLDADGVYNYYTAILNNTFTSVSNNYISSKLEDGLDKVISEANEGLNKGMPIYSEMLSDEIGGLIDGQLYLIGAGSGTGKTTFLLDCILPALLDFEVSACFLLNEQDAVKVKQQFLTYIINNIIITSPSKYFSSKRWREGKFTEEEMDWLRQASSLLENKIKENKIVIIELKTYNSKEVCRIIKQYASMGITKFFLDTLKMSESNGNSDNFWLGLMNDVLEYSNLIKPAGLNVHLTCTMQLQKINKLQRYLDNSLIGMSKSIIDTASVVILMRRFNPDEYPGMAHEIKVTKPIKDSSCFEEVVLNPKEHYQLAFITKNRNGCAEEYQIVARQELGTLIYKEVGIANIMPN